MLGKLEQELEKAKANHTMSFLFHLSSMTPVIRQKSSQDTTAEGLLNGRFGNRYFGLRINAQSLHIQFATKAFGEGVMRRLRCLRLTARSSPIDPAAFAPMAISELARLATEYMDIDAGPDDEEEERGSEVAAADLELLDAAAGAEPVEVPDEMLLAGEQFCWQFMNAHALRLVSLVFLGLR